MTPYVSKRLLGLVGILLFIAFVGFSSWSIAQAAGEPKTLDRNLEPVVIKGAQLNALLGTPIQHLFVYTFTGSCLGGQIPLQIDEVNAGGSYVSSEDGVLDSNDEVVFMARDVGTGGLAKCEQASNMLNQWFNSFDPSLKQAGTLLVANCVDQVTEASNELDQLVASNPSPQ